MGSAKQSLLSQTTPTAPPRKRRRRTVVSGAADDCFTCAKRGVQCDRRRPYCSQCIDLGQECSGYKTTLTWGVGVASRGKLRGLSLPVKGSRPATNPPKPHPVTDSTQPPQLTRTRLSGLGSEHACLAIRADPNVSMPQLSANPETGSVASSSATHMPQTCPSTQVLHADGDQMRNRQINAQDALSFDPLLSYIGASMSTRLSDHNQNWLEALPSSSTSYQWPSKAELQESEETAARRKSSTELRMESDAHDFLWTAGNSPSFSQLLLARSVGRTPRLRYLISYYVEVIAPVIVAFDGPTNPFRTQVLRLAQESESLQEAIATLSTNNMKQRREAKSMATGRTLPSRMSSLAQRALTEDTIEDHHDVYMLEGLSREEQYHRGMAVQALNAQLGDPHRRLSDSVLATLLILCLFHICDTGVAQFKTQFAGIKKLLAIRMRNAGTVTDGLKWYIRLFTWLDTLTATTNDREVELGGTCLDIATVQHEEWGLENLTGCDSKLFKMVAQLGRLNLLSRNQVVRAPTPPDRLSATMTLPASMFQSSFNSTYDVHLPGSEPNSINGFPLPAPGMSLQADQGFSPAFWTEWHSLHQKLESWHISRPNDEAIPSIASQSVNLSYLSPPSSPSSQCHISPENLPDVLNISESFRHAAILYCERLAYPSVPSNHPRIQSMVQAAMRHISAVQSDVFLLWPLFITGSECISEEHRTIIRRRCTDISKDSGFSNNLSCLDLLEKVWQQNADTGGGSAALDGAAGVYGMLDNPILGNMVPVTGVQMNDITGAPGERGFRWNRVMQAKRADGEYMVV